MNTAKKLSIRLEAVGGDKVRQEFKNIGSDGQKAFQRITQVITPANDNLKVLDNTAKAFNNTLKQAASLAGAYLGLRGLTNTFKSIVETNKEFERLSGSLKTVTGSAKAAKEAFTLIEDFATSTPFQLDEIVDSFIRLKAMGLEPSMEALTSYGNTASAFGKNILEFVSAVTSATVGEFERLKTFGIKAKVEGERVRFIFQGVTTEVGKNAAEIENYLRSIGKINFGGAMAEQMNTMGGTMSNIEDAMAKVARTIGESGLNKAIKEVLDQFNNLVSGTDGAAKTIGETLASAVTIAGKAFFTLGKYIEPIITLLTVRLGASLITKGIDLLKASVYALNVALMGTGTAGASATLGLKIMWQVSKVAAVQMYATAVAAEYPDFQPQAKAIQEKFLLLKAAEIDAQKARNELKYIQNPELRPKEEKPAVPKPPVLPQTDTSAYEKTIEDIKQKVFELQDPYDQAMQKAAKWRDNALANLDSTKAGYEDFKNDVNRVYDDMVKKAGEAALQSSKDWKDGVTRGMKSVYEDASDMASMTENMVKNSFKSMEDTLTNFVMTGKANFGDFVNSVVEGMVRMAMQYAVIKPIMGGVMGYFGIPTAHTGGVIGTDTLSTKAVSPSIFENAPRFHTGGLVGGEIPIIAKKGETVFTPGQMKALGAELNSKPPVYVNVNVVNKASGTRTTANPTRDMNGNVNLDIIVEQIEGAICKNISKGEGLSPILEQRYALNPAYGSYR